MPVTIAVPAIPFTDEELDGFRKAVSDKPESGGYQRLLATIDAMRKVIDCLPRCAGEVLGGSGGHAKHSGCDRAALWWFPSDMFAYCDEHMPKSYEKNKDYYEAGWTAELSAFDKAVRR